jgi:hypothetical protein
MSILELAKNNDQDIVLLQSLFESYKKNNDNIEDLFEQIVNLIIKQHQKLNTEKHTTKTVKKQNNPNTFYIKDIKTISGKLLLIIDDESNESLELDIENGNLEEYKKIITDGSFDKILLGMSIKKVI